MAVADFGGKVHGKTIDLATPTTRTRPTSAPRRRAMVRPGGVDMITRRHELRRAIAMAKVGGREEGTVIDIGAGRRTLTNEDCTPTRSTTHTTRRARQRHRQRHGQGRRQDLVLPDRRLRVRHRAAGSSVEGGEGQRRPGRWARCACRCDASDFSSFLLQAQGSKAQVLGLANAGGDTINSIKAANEFGITKTMKLAALLVFITDIHSLGLKTTQGLLLTDRLVLGQQRRDAHIRPSASSTR